MEVVVTRLGSGDEVVVAELVGLINRAYAAGEAGLWREDVVGVDAGVDVDVDVGVDVGVGVGVDVDVDVGRTNAGEIADAVGAGQMLVARVGGRIVGCLRTRALDPTTSDLGLVGVDPEAWGGGVGRALVDAAEDLASSRGATTMQLELLVPRTGTHPDKERLREWYTRRGYTVTRRVPFEDYVPHAAPLLTAPADILIFTKPLTNGVRPRAGSDPACRAEAD